MEDAVRNTDVNVALFNSDVEGAKKAKRRFDIETLDGISGLGIDDRCAFSP